VFERKMNTSENRSLAVRVGEVVTIGVMLFFLGAGIGLWQGHASGVEETTTALFAGPVATVIGLLLYFLVLKRTVTFAESAWIASGAGLAGIAVALFLKIASGGQLGWVSVFVTPLAAFLIALVLRRPR
jgi:hypothetical protein